MNFLFQLKQMLPLLYPKFYVVTDADGNELILLETGGEHLSSGKKIEDKTYCEGFHNHVHLFDAVKKNERETAVGIGSEIAKHLLEALSAAFPDKTFHVFFAINYNDSSTIRFHQSWQNEADYYEESVSEDELVMKFSNR